MVQIKRVTSTKEEEDYSHILSKENITYTHLNISTTINTYNTELPMVRSHTNKLKHIIQFLAYTYQHNMQFTTAILDTYITNCILTHITMLTDTMEITEGH